MAPVLVGRVADHLLSCLLVGAMLFVDRRATSSYLEHLTLNICCAGEGVAGYAPTFFLCSVAEHSVRCTARAMPQYLRHMNFSILTSHAP